MNYIARALRSVAWVELLLSAALLMLIVAVILAQVVLRYGWNSPIRWVEEVSVAAMIWLTFLAASLVYKEGRHVALWSPASHGRAGAAIGILIDALIVATAMYIVWIALPIVVIENRSMATSLPFELPKGYLFSVPVIFGFSSIAVTGLYFVSLGLLNIAGDRQEPRALSPIPPLDQGEDA